MRLNQFLARAGHGSRRACEELILSGQVFLNGQRITKLATRVGPNDSVSIAGKKLHAERPLTAMLYKPRGYICSTVEEGGAKTIFDLLPREWPRVFYVGRLDMDSEGLLLLTNNGELAQKMSHPSFKLPKIYEVRLNREFDFEAHTDKLRNGMLVEGKMGRFDAIHRLGTHLYKVVLSQGLKRQIRLMFEYVGYTVERLVRTQIGSLTLGDLAPGQYKIIHESEVEKLFRQPAGTTAPSEDAPSGAPQPEYRDQPPRRSRPFRPDDRGPRPRGDYPRRSDRRPGSDARPERPSYPRRDDRSGDGDSRPQRSFPGSHSARPSYPRRDDRAGGDEPRGERSERNFPVSRPGYPGGSKAPRRPFAARGPGSSTDNRTGYAYPKRPSPYGAKGPRDHRPGSGIPRRFGAPSAGGPAGSGGKTFSRGPQGPAGRRGPRPGGPSQGPRPGGKFGGPRRGH